MISKAAPELKDEAKKHWKEANEFQFIFISIIKKTKNKKDT